MTTTLTSIHDRIIRYLADVAPAILTEQLAQLVWELEDIDQGIDSALDDIQRQTSRLQQAHARGQSLTFDASVLASKQATLSERINAREAKVQLIMQLIGLLHKMTGTDSAVLRRSVFGSAS